MMMLFAGEGWGEGMSRMVIDDEMWSCLEKLLPKPKGRHGKERNFVARFFQKIKRFRRIATRYDKTARMYLTGVMFVSILLALK